MNTEQALSVARDALERITCLEHWESAKLIAGKAIEQIDAASVTDVMPASLAGSSANYHAMTSERRAEVDRLLNALEHRILEQRHKERRQTTPAEGRRVTDRRDGAAD